MERVGQAYRPRRHPADHRRRGRRASLEGESRRPAIHCHLVGPSKRASDTCALAGFGSVAVKNADLAEWDYGAYEGRTTKEILAGRPGWQLFRDGCPSGETAADVGTRADRIVAALRANDGNVAIFSSAHFLRVLAARWLGLPPQGGALFILGTASISVLGYEHDLSEPVIRSWNQT